MQWLLKREPRSERRAERHDPVRAVVADVRAAQKRDPGAAAPVAEDLLFGLAKVGIVLGTSLHRPSMIPRTCRTPGLLVMWNMVRSVRYIYSATSSSIST